MLRGLEGKYTLSGLLLALTAALILEGALGWPLAVAWLVAINVVTGLFYGIDKLNAEHLERHPGDARLTLRIPEPALLLLALAGGSLGALLAIVFRNHKISKPSFMIPFLLIVGLHLALLYRFRDQVLVGLRGP